jgi:hypothetical protein
LKISQCTACHLAECDISTDKWNLFTKWKQAEDWLADATFREHWKSFDCLCYNPGDGLVYAGLTATNGDFFYTFDSRSKIFESLCFPTQGDRYVHKIHAGLTLNKQGQLLGAVATLSDVDTWPHARGGEIFRFDPRSRMYTSLGIPFPHDYIKGITLDERRSMLYGNKFPGRVFFRFDLETGVAHPLTLFGVTLSEKILQDAQGCIWHNYHLASWANRTPLFRYRPDLEIIDFLNLDLPSAFGDGCSTIDSCLVTQDGEIYIGGSDGSLSRLDPEKLAIHYLGKPVASPRMKGLLESPEGLIYGAAGNRYDTHIFSYDLASSRFEILGAVQDNQGGTRCWIMHDLCLVDHRTIVAAETDNPQRASCLFVILLND